MLGTRHMTGIATVLTLGIGACDSEPEAVPVADSRPIAARQAPPPSGMQPLSPEAINQLKAEYPVLRQERAPEPRPRPDANPESVPPRLQSVASQKVLNAATGGATFYADKFEGRRTASGIPFRQNQLVAAHRSFPFGTLLRVTHLGNDRSVNVRVVDRGPFGSAAHKRRTLIDLSRRAATQLGFVDAGRAQVEVEVLEWGEGLPRAS
jgi:rare lipoprotein A